MGKLKAHVLREKTKSELKTQLQDLRSELNSLRMAQAGGGAASKLAKIGVVRKSIARVLTVMNNKVRSAMKEKYAESGMGMPKTFREKKTRAIRRKLTKEQANKLTTTAKKAADNFPARKFAVRS